MTDIVPSEEESEKVNPANGNGNDEIAEIEKEVTKLNPQVFRNIPKPQKQEIIRAFSVSMEMHKYHAGPLPDPETLEAYAELIPDGANRVMLMAEKQQDHRMSLESYAVRAQFRQSNLGQIFAFLIGLAALGSSIWVTQLGYPWPGAMLGVGGLTGLVTAFIKGKSNQNKSLAQKKPSNKK